MFKIVVILCLAKCVEVKLASQISSLQPVDYYHYLHLPHSPPLYPTLVAPPPTFSCVGRKRGYYADIGSGCQAYHFCWHQRLASSDLCSNGTLFNEQFQKDFEYAKNEVKSFKNEKKSTNASCTEKLLEKTEFSARNAKTEHNMKIAFVRLKNDSATIKYLLCPGLPAISCDAKNVCDHFYNVRCGSPYEDL